jgi:hypothetical protein
MDLPENWATERALGRLDVHHLIHTPCGFRSFVPFDLAEDERNARRLIGIHECDPAPPSVNDLTEDEYTALADQLPGPEEMTAEFAVVYYRRGELTVEGPYPRRLAEIKARDRGGRIAERTKTVEYGMWTPADSRLAEFDKASDEN